MLWNRLLLVTAHEKLYPDNGSDSGDISCRHHSVCCFDFGYGHAGYLGLNEEDWKKNPNQLSGGEAQRVGIVRAIINAPKILFADEPTGALNSASSRDVLDIFTEMHPKITTVLLSYRSMLSGS